MSSGTHRDLRILFAAWLTCLATGPIAAQDQRPRSERPTSERAAEQATTSSRRGAESTGKQQTRRLPAFPWSALRASDDSPASPAQGALQLVPRPGDLIRLGTKDGQTEWSTWGGTYEKFLEFLRAQNGPGRSDPDASISSILIKGTEEGDWAKLEATFEIQVERPDTRLTVPIGLQEGSISSRPKHSGPGEFRAGDSLNRQKGHTVNLRGKGLHVVTIPLIVPIRRQLNQRHLQLTIPPAAGSQITLRVAKEHCQVKPLDDAPVRATTVSNGTLIEAVGIKGTFDLAWESPLDESHARTVFDVFTKCSVAMDRDRIQWGVLQTIDAKQGTLASVRVRVPRSFPRVSGQQLYISEVRKYGPSDIDANGFIKVELKAPGTGRIELRWDLEGPPPPKGLLTLTGFDVEGARSDIGDISITPTEGFHFDYRGGGNIRRINVSALGAGLAESAYAMWQPFHLDLALEEIRPQFSVDPVYYLLLSQRRIELTSQFRIHVRKAPARAEVRLAGLEETRLDDRAASRVRRSGRSREAGCSGRGQRRGWTRRLHAGSAFEWASRGRFCGRVPGLSPRAGLRDEISTLAATACRLHDVGRHAGGRGRGEHQVDSRSACRNGRSHHRSRAARSLGSARFVSRPEAGCAAHRLPQSGFRRQVTTQQQKIETESRAKIEVRAGRLQVEQRISYRVSYERLTEATLVLPKELPRSNVQFTIDRPDLEAKIDPSWTISEPNGLDIARIPLPPQPRIGSFDLYAHYSVRMPESARPGGGGSDSARAFARQCLQNLARRTPGCGRQRVRGCRRGLDPLLGDRQGEHLRLDRQRRAGHSAVASRARDGTGFSQREDQPRVHSIVARHGWDGSNHRPVPHSKPCFADRPDIAGRLDRSQVLVRSAAL